MKDRINKKDLTYELYEKAKKMFFTKQSLDKNIPGSSLSEIQFLLNLLDDEAEIRTQNRRARYQKSAGFPIPKSFEEYDFSGITFPSKLPKDMMLTLDFIRNKEVLLYYGVCGSGNYEK